MKICYVITQSGDRSFWTRIGVAFVNRDGSLNVKLNCLPVTGEMTIRDYEPSNRNNQDIPRNPGRRSEDNLENTGDDEFPF